MYVYMYVCIYEVFKAKDSCVTFKRYPQKRQRNVNLLFKYLTIS